MKIEAREQALLKLVEDYRDRDCRDILAQARRRADEMLAQTYRKQREVLHQRVTTERARAEALIQAARAERATRLRRRGEQIDQAMLALVWPALRAALGARWADEQDRKEWVRGALVKAQALLPAGHWVVRHVPGWPELERQSLLEELDTERAEATTSHADVSITGGIIVASDGAILDATIEGLLADHARVEARMLALWKGQTQVDEDTARSQ